ncbi:MAG: hypothetical protein PHX50_11800 [Massilibacteroides sp.]|nr:hypothetical protein [Massilibacteroides sp.]MDD4661535.1 hypothetical protein [Massilibacteroides sp.]
MRKLVLECILIVFCAANLAADRWSLLSDGGIQWVINKDVPHTDHIEMSGLQISAVLRYGVAADGSFMLNRSIVWPMLRTIPNNTHASLTRRYAWNIPEMITVNGQSLQGEKVKSISLRGKIEVVSNFALAHKGKVQLIRMLFPSVDTPVFCEKYSIKNTGDTPISIEIPSSQSEIRTDATKGVSGSYRLIAEITGQTNRIVKPGEEVVFYATFAGYQPNETPAQIEVEKELQKRDELIAEFWSNLVLQTPDPVINTMFNFAKIRAAESIYKTKGGLMHGPGGESYYAAIWANDQAEYINPFFPFLGYETGNQSALNAFEHFARFMNPEYEKLPSSIIAEGIDTWGGAGDRGDAAMIAYGAARYTLARGDRKEAETLWPLIEWGLEYCRRNLNSEGVVASDSDELENRFPSGDANLCTSSLYYDALTSAVYLGKELRKPVALLSSYEKQKKELYKNIDRYFGGTVEGFDTYKYYKENDVLRSWICIPLTVGIYNRKEATIQALFSPRLWTENGLLTQAGSKTFWDRSTLYALRGIFACGAKEKGIEYLKYYSRQRLLGEHVPYAIEAWPEGSQRHLSAESGLYARIITEGLFGIRPAGFKCFYLTPQLPKEWDTMSLNKVRAFNSNFNIQIERENKQIRIRITESGKTLLNKKIKEGTALLVQLP